MCQKDVKSYTAEHLSKDMYDITWPEQTKRLNFATEININTKTK